MKVFAWICWTVGLFAGLLSGDVMSATPIFLTAIFLAVVDEDGRK